MSNERNRDTIRSYFATNQIPTGAQFAELIDSQLNVLDDGLVKPADDRTAPLGLTAVQGGCVLRLFSASPYKAGGTGPATLDPGVKPDWLINVSKSPRELAISDNAGNSRLRIDFDTGNVSVGRLMGQRIVVGKFYFEQFTDIKDHKVKLGLFVEGNSTSIANWS